MNKYSISKTSYTWQKHFLQQVIADNSVNP
jgi:hypothetical protein